MFKFITARAHMFFFLALLFSICFNSGLFVENQALAKNINKYNTNKLFYNYNKIGLYSDITSSLTSSLLAPRAVVDLEMSQAKIKSKSLAVKDNFSLQYKIKNDGFSGSAFMGIYFSKDKVLDKGDINAKYVEVNVSQKMNSGTLNLTVPSLADGKYYVITKIDDRWGNSLINESNETNNEASTNQPVEVNSPPVDIMATITNVNADYNYLVVNYTLSNTSEFGVGAWDAKMYFSEDQKIDDEDRIVAYINENSTETYLHPHSSLGLHVNDVYLFPSEYLPAGDYYILLDFNASRSLPETDYDNNIASSQQFTIKPYSLSLRIDQVHAGSKILTSDASIPMTLDWTNDGKNSIDGLYFDLQVEIAQAEHKAVSYHEQWVWLSSNESETIDIDLKMPEWIDGGEALITFSSDYTNTITKKVTITPDFKPAEIVLENLDQVFDGREKPVMATTEPTGLNVEITYDDEETIPVNAGNYKVKAKIKDQKYKGEAEAILKIAPAKAKIMLEESTVEYSGKAQELNVSTEPAGLPLKILYNGSEELPVNSGKYDVDIKVTDPNYQASANVEFHIMAKEVTVSFSDLEHVYDGEMKIATVTTAPDDLDFSIIYYDQDTVEQKPVNAGNYLVKVVGKESNYKMSAWATLNISKAQAEFTTSIGPIIYNQETHELDVKSLPGEVKHSIKYFDLDSMEVQPVNAGKYLVRVMAEDPNYHGLLWSTFSILPAKADLLSENNEVIYNGHEQAVNYLSKPSNLNIKYEYFDLDTFPAKPLNAGKYLVKAMIEEEQNYTAEAWGSLEIKPADISFSFANSLVDYTGNVQHITIIPSMAGIDYNVTYWQNNEQVEPINSGKYTVKVNATDNNYFGTAETTFTIDPAQLTFSFEQLEQEYTGNLLEVKAITQPANVAIKLSYYDWDTVAVSPLEAGEYLVKAESADDNYTGFDWAKMKITQAMADIVFEQLQHQYDGKNKKALVYTNPAGLQVRVKYDGKDELPVKAGTYEVTAIVEDRSFTGNEHAVLEIDKAVAEIVVGDLVFANNAPRISVSTMPSNLSYDMKFVIKGDTSATMPTEPGEYEVVIEIVDENFSGRLVKPMVITSGEMLEDEQILTVYPNPTHDFLSFNININDFTVKMMDTNGRLVRNWKMSSEKTIDISFAPKGTYFLAIQTNTKTFTKRIVKY